MRTQAYCSMFWVKNNRVLAGSDLSRQLITKKGKLPRLYGG